MTRLVTKACLKTGMVAGLAAPLARRGQGSDRPVPLRCRQLDDPGQRQHNRSPVAGANADARREPAHARLVGQVLPEAVFTHWQPGLAPRVAAAGRLKPR